MAQQLKSDIVHRNVELDKSHTIRHTHTHTTYTHNTPHTHTHTHTHTIYIYIYIYIRYSSPYNRTRMPTGQ
jgi:hypothetical protein